MNKQVEIFTDGSCLGNPGPGGYGILLRYQQHEKKIERRLFPHHQQSHGVNGRHYRAGDAQTPLHGHPDN